MIKGSLEQRKSDHIRINLEQDVASRTTTGLERLRFVHQALPELDMRAIDTTVSVFGKQLAGPLLISCMTGGTDEARTINRNLAVAAQAAGVAMGLGSMRAAVMHPEVAHTFHVRDVAPDILLMANLGAVQLNYGFGVEQYQRVVEMVQADVLVLHLNPLQEALQPEGEVNWSDLLRKIEALVSALPVPVIAKEVGWGISPHAARQLSSAGVKGIDVAGAGGTSWSQVEMYRAKTEVERRVAEAFMDWGISTVDSIRNVRESAPDLMVIASGGLRSGVDGAKCLTLGATLFGMAGPFLHAAVQSEQAVLDEVNVMLRQLRVVMLSTGAANLPALKRVELTGWL